MLRYETNSGVLVINGGLLSSVNALLPLGNITIEAHISDSLGASSIQQIQVQVMENLYVDNKILKTPSIN